MPTHDYEVLDVTVSDGVCHVRMTSSAPFNALTPTLVEELLDVAIHCNEEWDVRAIALTGSEGGFCAGADLRLFEGGAADPRKLRRLMVTLHEAIRQLHAADVPIVVGVNDVAAGAGFGLALQGDIVLVSDAARLEFAYTRIGLAADAGTTYLLPRLVGLRKAMEIVLLDEPIEPPAAVELGLATEVVAEDDFADRLEELAHDLAAGPTAAYAETRRLLRSSFDRGLGDQLAAEEAAMTRSIRTGDFRRGLKAFFGEGSPTFEGE
jgi:2-(1,2-epoxy-1,2-dihydrophenyl)acetyl-CoA isomerase